MTSNNAVYLLILILISISAAQHDDKIQPKLQSQFVKIEDYSKNLSIKSYFSISYLCTQKSLVFFRLQIEGVSRDRLDIIKRFMRCGTPNKMSYKRITLSLPNHLIYAPDHRNRFKYFPKKALFKVWMVPNDGKWKAFHNSKSRDHITVEFLMPHDRPSMPQNECKPWWRMFVKQSFYTPFCDKELETVEMLTYPLALSGDRVGVVHKLEPYNDLYLLKEYQKNVVNASFTYVFWIYIKDYCANSVLCSILHHTSWDEIRYTPLLYINRKGQLHLEVFIGSKTSKAYLSLSSLQKNKWMLLVFSCDKSEDLRVDVGYYPDFETKQLISVKLEKKLYFKDSRGNLILGGSDVAHSFEGYLGGVTFHRRKCIAPSEVQIPSSNHPMFLLRFQERYTNCEIYRNKVIFHNKKFIENHKTLKKIQKMCIATTTKKGIFESINTPLLCHPYDDPLFYRKYSFATKYIKSLIKKKQFFTPVKLSSALLDHAFKLIESEGLSQMPAIISLLKQSSCLGSDMAPYILSIIYNYGFSARMDETQSHSYLLQACYEANRLALMSMANKHTLGMDGVPMDYNQAYVYYMTAATITLNDIRSHSDEDTLTEMVRLTNEKRVDEQQGEDSDMYQWVRHQASLGVSEAQKYMATMLYWGSKGVKRNLTKASTYYKKAAESKSPSSLYNLALITLRGEGIEKNVNKALEMLKEGAAKNFSKSCLTLGWYYLVHLKDYVQAAYYLEKAFSLGDPDAGHNLAHMLLSGVYPGVNRVERRMAWKFISEAAKRGNRDSALLVSKFNMVGHISFKRSTRLSIEWSRYLSEQNPAVGKLLNKGVKAYRLKNWEASMLYYLLAADTGLEVANFNLAFLCEENHGYLSSNMQKECVYRHFNISARRSDQKDNSYAWLKLADLYYNQHNINMASNTYASTALKGDPQGLFNLGILVEEGVEISDEIWKSLGVPFDISRSHYALLHHIYDRCKNSRRTDAYWPCLLALTRVKIIAFYSQYHSWILTSCIAIFVPLILLISTHLVRSSRTVNQDSFEWQNTL